MSLNRSPSPSASGWSYITLSYLTLIFVYLHQYVLSICYHFCILCIRLFDRRLLHLLPDGVEGAEQVAAHGAAHAAVLHDHHLSSFLCTLLIFVLSLHSYFATNELTHMQPFSMTTTYDSFWFLFLIYLQLQCINVIFHERTDAHAAVLHDHHLLYISCFYYSYFCISILFPERSLFPAHAAVLHDHHLSSFSFVFCFYYLLVYSQYFSSNELMHTQPFSMTTTYHHFFLFSFIFIILSCLFLFNCLSTNKLTHVKPFSMTTTYHHYRSCLYYYYVNNMFGIFMFTTTYYHYHQDRRCNYQDQLFSRIVILKGIFFMTITYLEKLR